MEDHIYFMKRALENAQKSYSIKEVPVGAVVVCDGEVVAEGYNTRETSKNALCHAEIIAINNACQKLGGWRLHKCDIYVTMEPCPMCAGAIINSRIKRVIFGAEDKKAGCFGSATDFNSINFNHKPQIISGILKNECSQILTDFFKDIRKSKN